MSAVSVVENLLTLGMTVKDAFTKANQNGPTDWPAFIQSAEFTAIQGDVTKIIKELTKPEVRGAIDAVQSKKTALLGGKSIAALPPDKLLQFFDLLTVEGVLVRQELAQASASAAFFDWLVDEALPKLVAVAKVVLPLLL